MRRTSFLIALVATCWTGGGFVSGCGSDEPARTGSTGNNDDGGSRFNDSSAAQVELGAPCLEDADCPTNLVCVTQQGTDYYGGGPANGVCTAPCTINGDCFALNESSFCVPTNDNGTPRDDSDDTGFCFEGCFVGPPQAGEVKCHDRNDMACVLAYQDGTGVCLPTCRSDSDCGTRVCDLDLGVCVDASQRTGTLPIGAQCDPAALTDQCELGFCYDQSDTYAACSGTCSVGKFGCGTDRTSSGPLDSYCFPAYTGSAEGDIGFCYALCDCDDDCVHPDDVCFELSSSTQTLVGRRGTCVGKEFLTLDDGGSLLGLPCGSGTKDGGTDSGTSTPPDSGTSKLDAGTTPKDAATSD